MSNGQELAPWESSNPTTELAPWESPGRKPASENKGGKVVQTMHPDIGGLERFVVKNFSNNIDASIKYLQDRHPDMFFDGKDGRIIAKRKDEKDWQVLDPEFKIGEAAKATMIGGLNALPTSVVPEEYLKKLKLETFKGFGLQDISDVLYDGLHAVGAGVATAAGGVGAAAATGGNPYAALAGASAAGGAASEGLELLRQKIGNALGIEQDVDWDRANIAGATGVVAPALLGTGATAGQIAAKNIPAASQRGLIGKAFQGGLPKVAGLTSGVPAKHYVTYYNNRELIKTMTRDGVHEYAEMVGKGIEAANRSVANKVKAQLNNYIRETDVPIDTGSVRQLIRDKIKTLDAPGNPPVERNFAKKLRKFYQDNFARTKEDGSLETYIITKPDGTSRVAYYEQDTLVDGQGMFALKKRLSDVVKGIEKRGNLKESDLVIKGTALDAKKQLDTVVDAALEKAPGIRDAYRKQLDMDEFVKNNFYDVSRLTGNKNYDRTYSTLVGLDKNSKRILNERLKDFDAVNGTDILNKAEILQTHAFLGNPKSMPISSGGTTSTSATISTQKAAGSAGYVAGRAMAPHMTASGRLGATIGEAMGGFATGPKQWRFYQNTGRAAENLAAQPLGKNVPGQVPWQALQRAQQDEQF